MKKLADGIEVSSMSYYFLLDWNDTDNKKFIISRFKKQRLMDLNVDEYEVLWLYATNDEHEKLLKK